MKLEIKARLKWVQEYEKTGNAGIVCRRCGISRPTLRKWYKRYLESGLYGLQDKSKRPHISPNTKVTDEFERIILKYRKNVNLVPEEYKTNSSVITIFLYPSQLSTKF